MVRITKVYTKTGDKGETHLAAGKKIPKTSPRIDAIGSIDELNAFLGFAAQPMNNNSKLHDARKKIIRIQNTLFDLGASLAVLKEDRRENTPEITAGDIKTLENEIDSMNSQLQPLQSFILPGGGEIASRLHLARTICRRAERALVKLNQQEKLDENVIPFINRLSDWLFVISRLIPQQLGENELLWEPGKREY